MCSVTYPVDFKIILVIDGLFLSSLLFGNAYACECYFQTITYFSIILGSLVLHLSGM